MSKSWVWLSYYLYFHPYLLSFIDVKSSELRISHHNGKYSYLYWKAEDFIFSFF